MKQSIFTAAVLVGVLVMLRSPVLGHDDPADEKSSGKPELKLETLLRTVLEGIDGKEVIVSRVTLPPNASLPKHWHPGEEIGYVLEGSLTLWQKGKDDIVCKRGDTVKVPLKQVHTAITKGEGATVLIFRVHELGEPERIVVEGD